MIVCTIKAIKSTFFKATFLIKAVTFDETEVFWYFHLNILVTDWWWFQLTSLGIQYSWSYPKTFGSNSEGDFQLPTREDIVMISLKILSVGHLMLVGLSLSFFF